MIQWALAWSWIGEPLPGFHTRRSYSKSILATTTKRYRWPTYNIRFVVDIFDSISGIVLAGIVVEILNPITGIGDVFLRQGYQVCLVHLFRGDPTRLAKMLFDVLHETVKVVPLLEGLIVWC